MTAEHSEPNSAEKLRWPFWLAGLTGGSIIAFLLSQMSSEFSLTRRPLYESYALGLLANGLFAALLIFYPGVSRARKWTLFGALIVAQTGFLGSLKQDGYYGSGRPKFTWRWSKLAADREFQSSENTEAKFDADIAPEWPGFRGQNRSGTRDDVTLADWNADPPRLLWSRDVGAGWSSFAVADRICVTQEQRSDTEFVVCYDLETGDELWKRGEDVRYSNAAGGEGPRATPTIDGEHVFTFGATGILNCRRVSDGASVWRRDILVENGLENLGHGMCGSPLVVNDLVLVSPGGTGTSLIALNRKDGNGFGRRVTRSVRTAHHNWPTFVAYNVF